jgi:hypothetical protein
MRWIAHLTVILKTCTQRFKSYIWRESSLVHPRFNYVLSVPLFLLKPVIQIIEAKATFWNTSTVRPLQHTVKIRSVFEVRCSLEINHWTDENWAEHYANTATINDTSIKTICKYIHKSRWLTYRHNSGFVLKRFMIRISVAVPVILKLFVFLFCVCYFAVRIPKFLETIIDSNDGGWVVNTSASYSRRPGFKSRPRDRPFWLRPFVVFLNPPKQMPDSNLN